MVARRAHNPKVAGSSPAPATPKSSGVSLGFFYGHFLQAWLIIEVSHISMEKQNKDEAFQWLELDRSDLLFMLRRYSRLLLIIPFIGAVLGVVIAKLLTPVFETKATVYLRPNFDKEMQLERTHSKLDDNDSLRSIEKAMTADSVILAMVEKLGPVISGGKADGGSRKPTQVTKNNKQTPPRTQPWRLSWITSFFEEQGGLLWLSIYLERTRCGSQR